MRRENVIRDYIKLRLQERQAKDPSYSLRKFAKDLGVSAGSLSSLMNGSRPLSEKNMDRIFKSLGVSEDERQQLLDGTRGEVPIRLIEHQQYLHNARWFFHAILELTRLKEFDSDPHWIAKKLDISVDEVEGCLEHMILNGWIKKDPDSGHIKVIENSTEAFSKNQTSVVIKRLLSESNELSKKALTNDPVETRFHAFNTVAIDMERLEEAKEYLREFRRKFCKRLEKNCGELNGIYHLSIGFFRIDQELEEMDENQENIGS